MNIMANSQELWSEFVPTADEPWDLKKVAHLHRRAGLAATWAELQRDLKEGPATASARASLIRRTPSSSRRGGYIAFFTTPIHSARR